MSTPIAQYKLPSRIEIGFDSGTKASIADLKTKLDAINNILKAKDSNGVDGLVKAMRAEAANDSNGIVPQRETINDVEYLSEIVPYIDEYDWASESVPQITQTDMQLIFIKNLSEVLIQRMHSMDRFSEDDYAIGGDDLMTWDILIYEPLNSYAVLIDNRQKPKIADLLFFWDAGAAADANWNTDSDPFATLRTITEAELPAFRAALEVCYA